MYYFNYLLTKSVLQKQHPACRMLDAMNRAFTSAYPGSAVFSF